MEAQVVKKFHRVHDFLKIGGGVEIPNQFISKRARVVDIPKFPRVVEIRQHKKRDSSIVYLSPEENGSADNISILIPGEINIISVSWAQLILARRIKKNNSARITFARKYKENKPFFFGKSNYIPLRIWRPGSEEFNPVFVRVDHYEETEFLFLSVKWIDKRINIKIFRDVSSAMVPGFLKCLS